MNKFLWFFGLALAAFTGWYFYSPMPVLQDFQAALNTGKPEAIVPFLDMPAIRQNLVDFTNLRFNSSSNSANNISADQVNSMVNDFLTPANILLVAQGVRIEPGKTEFTGTIDRPSHPLDDHYTSFDQYDLDIYFTPAKAYDQKDTLVFKREGLFNWKLSAIRFAWL